MAKIWRKNAWYEPRRPVFLHLAPLLVRVRNPGVFADTRYQITDEMLNLPGRLVDKGADMRQMRQKLALFLGAIFFALILSGCTSNGIASVKTSAVDSKQPTTISGTAFLPLNANSALLGRISADEADDANEAGQETGTAENAQAFVNGTNCPVSFQSTSTALNFVISSIPQGQSSYLVELTWGKVGMKTKTTGTTNIIVSPQTTAAVLVGEKAAVSPTEVLASFSRFLSPLIQEIEEAFTLDPESIPTNMFILPDLTKVVDASARAVTTGLYTDPEDGAAATGSENDPTSAASGSSTIQASPTVLIISPVQDSVFEAGSPVTILGAVSIPGKIVSRVEFMDGSVKLGEVASEPYSWKIEAITRGTHMFRIRAVTENSEEFMGQSVAVTVPDETIIRMISPDNGARFGLQQTVTLKAEVSGNLAGVQKVEFRDFDTLLTECFSPPFEYVWNEVPEGAHHVMARVRMAQGSEVDSDGITFSVVPPPNQAPIVNIATPTGNQEIALGKEIIIEIQASDPDGTIQRVEILSGIVKLAELTQAPFTYTWKGAFEGSYILTAKAVDNKNLESRSAPVTIHVKPIANQPPTVSLIHPDADVIYQAFATIAIQAIALDSDGEIEKVEFFNGPTKLGEVTTIPYQFFWNNVPMGTHSITARAVDDSGTATISAPTAISVLEDPLAP